MTVSYESRKKKDLVGKRSIDGVFQGDGALDAGDMALETGVEYAQQLLRSSAGETDLPLVEHLVAEENEGRAAAAYTGLHTLRMREDDRMGEGE